MAARQNGDPRPDLEVGRAGQRVGHADEGLHLLAEHDLRQPQRVDTERLGPVDHVGEPVERTVGDPEANLHASIVAPIVTVPAAPSTVILSPVVIREVASITPTTAGIPYSR